MDKATTSSIETIARTCIAVRLRLLNRVVTNFYDDALGLKVSQLNVLIVTARLSLARIRISSGKIMGSLLTSLMVAYTIKLGRHENGSRAYASDD